MVVSLGPGKFYGSSLPRPYIYTDPKFNSERVDPPVSAMDPLLSWAQEAHWSMGGLSFQRLRLQGRIEGNIDRLRKQRDKQIKLQSTYSPPIPRDSAPVGAASKKNNKKARAGSDSPPAAPQAMKRRRFMDLFDEGNEGEEEEAVEERKVGKKRPARKLVGEFDRVAGESKVAEDTKTGDVGRMVARGRRSEIEGDGVGEVGMKVVEKFNRDNSEGKKLKGGKNGKRFAV